MADAECLRAWRNDPETRRQSFQARPVSLAEHTTWLYGVLTDPSRMLWIAEEDGRPVASGRLDARPGGWAEVHITVDPAERGRGVGTAVIAALVEQAKLSLYAWLQARIKPNNAASRQAFAANGFRIASRDEDEIVMERAV